MTVSPTCRSSRTAVAAAAALAAIFHSSNEVTHFACSQDFCGNSFDFEDANFFGLVFQTRGKEPDRHVVFHGALENPDGGHCPPVAVEDGVEDQRLKRRVWIASWGWNLIDDALKQFVYADPGFGADFVDCGFFYAEQVVNLHDNAVHIHIGQVDFVDDRDDGEVVTHGQQDVAYGLGFHALACVYQEQGTFASCKTSGDFVGKIHVPGCVDEVEDVVLAVWRFVSHSYGVGFDGDTAFPFQVHAVQNLIHHLILGQGEGFFQEPVGQGRFSVVDVGNNAEVADVFGAHPCGLPRSVDNFNKFNRIGCERHVKNEIYFVLDLKSTAKKMECLADCCGNRVYAGTTLCVVCRETPRFEQALHVDLQGDGGLYCVQGDEEK